jgi:hypothetical protein
MVQTNNAFKVGRMFGLREAAEIVCVHCHNKFEWMEGFSGRIHDNGERCDAKYIFEKIDELSNTEREHLSG